MRKFLLPLLLAGAVATPAIAGPRDDDSDRRPNRAERQQVREERQQAREERTVRPERPQFNGPVNGGQARFNGAPNGGQPQFVRRDRVEQAQPVQQVQPGNVPQNVREWRGRRVVETDGQTLRQPDRPLPNMLRVRNRTPVVSEVPRPGTQPPLRLEGRRHSTVNWSTNWRNDHRYDWRDWRRRHNNWFHLGIYYDPFGWGYQPYSIGWRMWPSYYGSNYWINDPWQYRLPYAPPGYRWVRYYDDAVLVDTWTGEVVDVLYNFFW